MDDEAEEEFDRLFRQLDELRQQLLLGAELEEAFDPYRGHYDEPLDNINLVHEDGDQDEVLPPDLLREELRADIRRIANEVENEGDDVEAEIEWDVLSAYSLYSRDSGFVGSLASGQSDVISDVISEYSSFTERLRHDEQCHFGFLIEPDLVRDADPIVIRPGPSKEQEVIDWMKNNEAYQDHLNDRCMKRKRSDDDDYDVDCEGPGEYWLPAKKQRNDTAVCSSTSDVNVYSANVLWGRFAVRNSYSDTFVC